MFEVERDPRAILWLFLMPLLQGESKGVSFFFKHIKFEILMIYRERKRERESGRERERGTRGRGGGRGV